MNWALTWMVAAIFLLSATSALPDDDLVRQMEIDIAIQRLAKETLEAARNKAWTAVKQTSLWRDYQAAGREYRTESKKIRALINEKRTAHSKLSMQRVQHELEYGPKRYLHGRINEDYVRQFEEFIRTDAVYRDISEKMARIRIDIDLELRGKEEALVQKWEQLENEVNDIADKFAHKIYLQQMKKELAKLAIEITKDVLKKIERSYKFREA